MIEGSITGNGESSHEACGSCERQERYGGAAGCYTVVYEDGASSEIKLERNINIGPEDVRWGRRYNPLTHSFDTDRRLESLCCMTIPVRKIKDDGTCVMDFEFEWINPRPSAVIKEIYISTLAAAGILSVKVTAINIVGGWNT